MAGGDGGWEGGTVPPFGPSHQLALWSWAERLTRPLLPLPPPPAALASVKRKKEKKKKKKNLPVIWLYNPLEKWQLYSSDTSFSFFFFCFELRCLHMRH